MEGGEFNVVMPQEMAYPLPASFPAGLKGIEMRVPNMNTIPSPTPATQNIQIMVPEQPASFLDTKRSALYVECTYRVTLTLGNNAAMYINASAANGGFIGSGASMFQRYQLYLNNAMISDDINEFGMVTYLVLLLNFTEEQRFLMAKVLGLNKGYPSGCWGAAFHGSDMQDRATFSVPTGGVFVETAGQNGTNTYVGNGRQVIGANALQYTANSSLNNPTGVFWACTASAPAVPITVSAIQNYNFTFYIPGILGAGNGKMLPMFGGPYRIDLYMDSIQNYYNPDFGQSQPAPPGGSTAQQTFNGFGRIGQADGNGNMTINSVWYLGIFYRCDVPTFNIILGSLPRPNTFIFRTTAFTVSSINIAAGSQGQTDLLIPPRRASIKSLYCLPSPGAFVATPSSAPAAWNCAGYVCNPWLKYGWVNPNLTNGTCILLNGIQYPQQTNDPLNRPSEMQYHLLNSLETWSDMGTKPCIADCNFFVCDSLPSVNFSMGTLAPTVYTNGVQTGLPIGSGYFTARNNTNTGQALWRILASTTTRVPLVDNVQLGQNAAGNNVYTNGVWLRWATGIVTAAAIDATNPLWGAFQYPGVNLNALPNNNLPVAMSDKGWSSNVVGKQTMTSIVNVTGNNPVTTVAAIQAGVGNAEPCHMHFIEGTSCAVQQSDNGGKHSYTIPHQQSRPYANQFIYPCNLDQITKKDILAGTSSLTGSFFFRVNIATPLSTAYLIYFIVVYDSLCILDVALKTASVRY